MATPKMAALETLYKLKIKSRYKSIPEYRQYVISQLYRLKRKNPNFFLSFAKLFFSHYHGSRKRGGTYTFTLQCTLINSRGYNL